MQNFIRAQKIVCDEIKAKRITVSEECKGKACVLSQKSVLVQPKSEPELPPAVSKFVVTLYDLFEKAEKGTCLVIDKETGLPTFKQLDKYPPLSVTKKGRSWKTEDGLTVPKSLVSNVNGEKGEYILP